MSLRSFLRCTLRLLCLPLVLCTHIAAGAEDTSEELDLSAPFGAYSGAFVLYDAGRRHWIRFHPERCRVRTTPCSTFKVLNSLIFLETGVAAGPDYKLRWDGKRHPIEPWNQDHTLRSAIAVSCLWYYEALAARVGMERLDQLVKRVGYGNQDTSGGLPHFWVQSSLTISPDEQVAFLRRLSMHDLPFSKQNMDTVLDIMTLSKSGSVIFRGKTGTAGDGEKQIATLGWFIGSVSRPGGDCFFATRITEGDNPSGRTARGITEAILDRLKYLPKVNPDS